MLKAFFGDILESSLESGVSDEKILTSESKTNYTAISIAIVISLILIFFIWKISK